MTKAIAARRAQETVLTAVGSISRPTPANSTPLRWTCRHHMDGSEITAYVAASGGLEIIAQTRQTDSIDARANAALIVQAVNNHDRYWPIINDLAAALEQCLKCEGLTWAAEQEADLALRRTRGVIGT